MNIVKIVDYYESLVNEYEDFLKEKDEKVRYLEYKVDRLLEAVGPASDDVEMIIREEYDREIPKEYR